jgi:hypothetical protein
MAQDENPQIDSGLFRNVLGHFPTGVTVVTATGADRPIGVAIGSFVSISLEPPLVGFFLGTQSGSWPPMEEAGHFCVGWCRCNAFECRNTRLNGLLLNQFWLADLRLIELWLTELWLTDLWLGLVEVRG